MIDSEIQAVIKEYGGTITEQLAEWILAFRKTGDDVVEEKPK